MIVYLMIGLPGSGKTTWAKQNKDSLKAVHISKDEIRWKYAKNKQAFYAQEDLVLREMIMQIQYCINNNFNCIIDTTNINYDSRAKIARMIKLKPTDIIIAINIRSSVNKCISRNSHRPERDKIESHVITRMGQQAKFVDDFNDMREMFKYYGILDINNDGTQQYRERGK